MTNVAPIFIYQVVITKLQSLEIIYTEGENLSFPDILSQNITLADAQLYQLEHKVIPKDIKFHINGKKLTTMYYIKTIRTQQLPTVIRLLLK